MRSLHYQMVTILVGWGAGASAAEDPEAVLKARGLSRSGLGYILQQEEAKVEEARQGVRELNQKYNEAVHQHQQAQVASQTLSGQIASLRSRANAESRAADERKEQGKGGGGDHERKARDLKEEADRAQKRLNAEQAKLSSLEAEGQRIQALLPGRETFFQRLFGQLNIRYAELAMDEEIKTALRTLNAGRKSPYVLGPALNPAAYWEKVKLWADEFLRDTGMVRVPKDLKYIWPSDQALAAGLARRVEALHEEAKPPPTPADLAAERKRLEEQVRAARTNAARILATNRLNEFDRKRRKPVKPPRAEAREEFLRALAELRQVVDQAQRDLFAQQQDAEITLKLAHINTGLLKSKRYKLSTFPDLRKAEALLAELVRAYTLEVLTLTRSGSDRPEVEVRLGAGPARRLTVDPRANEVRIPAGWAEGVAAPAEGDGAATVTLADGRNLPVRRAVLDSLRIGTFEVRRVPCLILPDGEEDAAVLGRSVLDRFLAWIDLGTDRLTLALAAEAPPEDGVRVLPPAAIPAEAPRRPGEAPEEPKPPAAGEPPPGPNE